MPEKNLYNLRWGAWIRSSTTRVLRRKFLSIAPPRCPTFGSREPHAAPSIRLGWRLFAAAWNVSPVFLHCTAAVSTRAASYCRWDGNSCRHSSVYRRKRQDFSCVLVCFLVKRAGEADQLAEETGPTCRALALLPSLSMCFLPLDFFG